LNHGQLTANQISRQYWQSIVLVVCPVIFDGDILAIEIAGIL
jgi:hypothetical protein